MIIEYGSAAGAMFLEFASSQKQAPPRRMFRLAAQKYCFFST